MRSLLIIRHAKSDWDNPRLPDFDRPLNERGHRNAIEMAGRLLERNTIPDLILSSPALRAKTTAMYFAETLKMTSRQMMYESAIYEASLKTLTDVVNSMDDRYNRIALFGHNPGLTYLAEDLAGEPIGNLPTCAIVHLEFPFDEWKLVSSGTGKVRLFDYPKNKP